MTWRKVKEVWECETPGTWRKVKAAGTPGPGSNAPGVPTGLDYTATQTSATVTWVAPVGGATVDHFELRVNGGTPVSVFALAYELTGLSAGTVYGVDVRCIGTTGLASDWAPLQVTTASAPAGPYSPLWGYAVGNNGGGSKTNNYNRQAAHMGAAEVIRDFYPGTTFDWPPQSGAYSAVSPQPVFIQSWKPNYSAIMNGSQDSYILSRVASMPTTRVTALGAWHEWGVKKYGDGSVPASGPQTEAQFAAMQNYLADLVHGYGNPMVRWAVILGAYDFKSRWDRMLAGGLDVSRYDYVLYDPYRGGSYTYAPGYKQVDDIAQYLRDTWGMPTTRQGLAEIGVGTSAPDPARMQGAADNRRGAIQAALDHNYWCVCWFESGPNSYMLGNPPASGPALAARPELLAMWQAMRAANP